MDLSILGYTATRTNTPEKDHKTINVLSEEGGCHDEKSS